ncbi:MAG: hypothetical protein AAF329_05635 [Cyanobacteria bacterium P01_A01_bin.17]
MPTCVGQSTKRLLIATPQAVKDAFSPPSTPTALDRYFDGTVLIDGVTYPLLRLWVSPLNYRRVTVRSQDSGTRFYLSGTSYIPYSEQRNFEVTVPSDRAEILWLLQRLEQISNSSAWEGAPEAVTVHDYVSPDIKDVVNAVAAETEAFTVRQGFISVEEIGGLRGRLGGKQYVPGGFKLKFESVELQ